MVPSDSRRPLDVRRALIDAGRALLNVEGAEGLSLRAAARAANVSPGAPYKHFADKRALLEAIADEGFHDLAIETRRAFDRSVPGAERVRALCLVYVRFALQNPLLYQIMISTTRGRETVSVDEQGQAEVVRLMRLGIAEAAGTSVMDRSTELRALAIWFALHGLIDLHSFRAVQTIGEDVKGRDAFLEEIVSHIVDNPDRSGMTSG